MKSAGVAHAIARFEARRLLRHPLLGPAALASPSIVLIFTWDLVPVMHIDDALVGVSLVPLGLVTLLLLDAAVLRAAKDVAGARAAPSDPATIATGHLWSVAATIALALVMVGIDVAILYGLGGIWSPSLWELLTGPLIVAGCGAVGVALGTWLPWPLAGPVAVVALLTIGSVLPGRPHDSLALWLGFYVPPLDSGVVGREAGVRPVTAHLAYLAGLAVLFAVVAFLRHGRTMPRLIAVALGLALLGSGIAFTAVELRDPSGSERLIATECEQKRGIRLCLSPAYRGYFERALPVVQGVLKALPERAVVPVTITQDVLPTWARLGLEPPEGPVFGARWGRGEAAGRYEFALALQVAVDALEFPTGEHEFVPSPRYLRDFERRGLGEFAHGPFTQDHCYSNGEARSILALWLAGQASPGAASAMREEARTNPPPPYIFELPSGPYVSWCCETFSTPRYPRQRADVIFGTRELAYALQLLEKLDATSLVHRTWDRLRDPSTTTRDALAKLGLKPLPSPEEKLRRANLPPRVEPAVDAALDEPRCRDVEVGA